MHNAEQGAFTKIDKILDSLICPVCHQELQRGPKGFDCMYCKKFYPVIDGIPRFILEYEGVIEETRKSFDLQWEMSRKRGEYNQFDPEYKEKLVSYLLDDTMIPADYFKGKIVLDAGCGVGRLTYALTQLGAYVIAVDYNDEAVKIAHEYFRNNPRISVIQADILNLPFAKESFDFILSFGVLHHTGNTKEAFDKIVPLVKDNGIFFVMLYEKYNHFKLWFTDQFRKLTLRMKKEKLYRLSIFMSNICKYAVFRFPLKPFIDIGYSAEGNYDAFAKSINEHHTAEEIFHWYINHGFCDIAINASRRFSNPFFRLLQGKWGGTVRMRGRKGESGVDNSNEKLHLITRGTKRHI